MDPRLRMATLATIQRKSQELQMQATNFSDASQSSVCSVLCMFRVPVFRVQCTEVRTKQEIN